MLTRIGNSSLSIWMLYPLGFSPIENINETKNNKYALPDHPCEQPTIMTINNTVIDNF